MALTAKQQRFIAEYLIDLNAAQAAIRAGYAVKGAKDQAYQLMQRPEVVAAIKEAIEARNQRVQVDADYVLNRLTEIDQMDLLDILDDDMSIKPLSKWPKVWRQSLSGFDIAEMFEGVGKERDLVGLMKKIKWPDKVKNLELLGKHVNVNAFRENVNHSGSINLTNMTDEELDRHIAQLSDD
ncbi:terminase small subunit [Pseudomonas lundensis]|uniref:Terminase small subunit n=1 Tax=Pseudomonas lundensis TaxID=86185 RepID=A0AAX2HE77_9PSED|nr:terminase small subunit [Pseudomonas lundensis]SOB54759.1 Terminase small subunit [Pseudomonas lundensis]